MTTWLSKEEFVMNTICTLIHKNKLPGIGKTKEAYIKRKLVKIIENYREEAHSCVASSSHLAEHQGPCSRVHSSWSLECISLAYRW